MRFAAPPLLLLLLLAVLGPVVAGTGAGASDSVQELLLSIEDGVIDVDDPCVKHACVWSALFQLNASSADGEPAWTGSRRLAGAPSSGSLLVFKFSSTDVADRFTGAFEYQNDSLAREGLQLLLLNETGMRLLLEADPVSAPVDQLALEGSVLRSNASHPLWEVQSRLEQKINPFYLVFRNAHASLEVDFEYTVSYKVAGCLEWFFYTMALPLLLICGLGYYVFSYHRKRQQRLAQGTGQALEVARSSGDNSNASSPLLPNAHDGDEVASDVGGEADKVDETPVAQQYQAAGKRFEEPGSTAEDSVTTGIICPCLIYRLKRDRPDAEDRPTKPPPPNFAPSLLQLPDLRCLWDYPAAYYQRPRTDWSHFWRQNLLWTWPWNPARDEPMLLFVHRLAYVLALLLFNLLMLTVWSRAFLSWNRQLREVPYIQKFFGSAISQWVFQLVMKPVLVLMLYQLPRLYRGDPRESVRKGLYLLRYLLLGFSLMLFFFAGLALYQFLQSYRCGVMIDNVLKPFLVFELVKSVMMLGFVPLPIWYWLVCVSGPDHTQVPVPAEKPDLYLYEDAGDDRIVVQPAEAGLRADYEGTGVGIPQPLQDEEEVSDAEGAHV